MPRFFVIPLYSHTREPEIAEIRESLERIGLDSVYVAYEAALPPERDRDRLRGSELMESALEELDRRPFDQESEDADRALHSMGWPKLGAREDV